MSSSYRNAAALALLASAFAAPLWAQQSFMVPSIEVTGEYNTNREMTTNSALEDASKQYKAVGELRWMRRTPRSETQLRPRIVFQSFPDREGIDPIEGFLDFRTGYKTLKGGYSLASRYARQDTYNAEFGAAGFDNFDPENPDPNATDTGIVLIGQTRTRWEVEPGFQRTLTERFNVDGALRYESVRYGSNDLTLGRERVGYDSPYAELSLVRKMGPRTSLGLGPYLSRYETDDDTARTDSVGALFELDHQWSEVNRMALTVRGEQNDTEFLGTPEEESTTNWGVEFIGTRKNRVGGLRYRIGRFLQPSGLGSRRESDELNFQYDRPLSERLIFKGAIRLARDQRVGNLIGDEERRRARAEVSLTRLMSERWSIAGGYRYAWQDFELEPRAAENHGVFITFGFRGLNPQQRTAGL